MPVSALHHFTVRCMPEDLGVLFEFYTRHLGLTDGPRPVIPFPGHWLYSEGQPIVHLAAFLDRSSGDNTGPLDHISFRAHGLERTRAYFSAQGIAFEEAPVPGWPLHQVFVRDPKGLKIELTFSLDEEAAGQP
jgi:catechol 2,3-dioxygenase-like lactoylglutathione lyase family enzyme